MPEPQEKLRRLLGAGSALASELDSDAVLQRVLEQARELTGARYAALGVLDESRRQLERFLTLGIDEATHRSIGDLPRGRGVLGVLIQDPNPLRCSEVGEHPLSYGFPPGHPPMGSFLGVPIIIRGEAWGNLYLAEKQGSEPFSDEDEEAVLVLAQWAATAIENARLYESSEHRRELLERAVRSLEAARDIADAISGMPDLDRVLELIVKRGRALVSARTVLILLRDGGHLVVAASAGHAADAIGRRIPIAHSTSGQILRQGRPERIADVATRLRITPENLGVPDAHSALLVPMLHRGEGLGVLAAFDRGPEAGTFTTEDEQLLRTFAASAGNAVAINRSVEAERLRGMVAAADFERGRWARELHDQTLQSLGALRVALASIIGRGDAAARDEGIRRAIGDVELEIGNLRGIITDLRPSILDDLGLKAALEALLDRRRGAGLQIIGEIGLAGPGADDRRLSPALETTVYRIVQEAVTNVTKHARARTVHVSVSMLGDEVLIEVQDDGVGFDPDRKTPGFGVTGMRERAYLAGGHLQVESSELGTSVRVRLPADSPQAAVGSLDHVTR
ncbi:MAG TPA: GAF domain-containing sensor histidine kinase [Solirubrobacteraceae bacterium]|nr:GAF domain-containing sensor histidine kinase [Solirubrobacteraceae bacterium]